MVCRLLDGNAIRRDLVGATWGMRLLLGGTAFSGTRNTKYAGRRGIEGQGTRLRKKSWEKPRVDFSCPTPSCTPLTPSWGALFSEAFRRY